MNNFEIALLIRGLERLVIDACVPILLYIGYRLFVRGVEGSAEIEVNATSVSGKLKNASPGLACMFIAAALGATSLFLPFKYEYSPGSTTDQPADGKAINAKISFFVPIGLDEPLSARVLRDVSAYSICVDTSSNPARCKADLLESLSSLPTEQTVERIIALEASANEGKPGAQRELNDMATALIRKK